MFSSTQFSQLMTGTTASAAITRHSIFFVLGSVARSLKGRVVNDPAVLGRSFACGTSGLMMTYIGTYD